MSMSYRRELRNQNPNQMKEHPNEQMISEINQMINSIPEVNDNEKLNTVETIMLFINRFDYDLYNSLSPEEIYILFQLMSYQSTKVGSFISCNSIYLFTFFIKNDHKLFDDFMKLNIVQTLISNMINTADANYHISCIAFLYEMLKINNELRDGYLSYDLPDFIIYNCSPFQDKIFFEFLTLLATKPSYLPEISLKIIQSFITQEVTQKRAITVIKCLITFIRADESLIIPILSSDFLRKIVSSLGSVTHTIAMFLKFSFIAIQINQPNILDAFLNINIFDILKSSLELVARKEIAFVDMLISSMKADMSSGTSVISANDNLLKQSSNLMNALLQFDDCLKYMEFISEFDYASTISDGLSYKTIEAIIRMLLNYSIKMPISIAKKVMNEEIIKNAFFIASSSNEENNYTIALSAIASKFANDEDITNIIKITNEEYDNVIIN